MIKEDRFRSERIVRYDPKIGHSTLFRPLQKRGQRSKLDIRYSPQSGGGAIEFRGPDALGIPEQTLLLALVELAQATSTTLNASSERSEHRELWLRLVPSGATYDAGTVTFTTTWRALAKVCGLAGGGAVQQSMQQQLRRLCETTVWEFQGQEAIPKRQSMLVAWLAGSDKQIHLALNFRLAAALCCDDQYTPVSMSERLKLRSDIARAVHAFLSSTVRPGRQLPIGLQTLVSRFWPEQSAATPEGTTRRRQKAVRDALKEVSGLCGWIIRQQGKAGQFVIHRPRLMSNKVSQKSAGNAGVRFRDRITDPEVSNGAAFGGIDVSGLFPR